MSRSVAGTGIRTPVASAPFELSLTNGAVAGAITQSALLSANGLSLSCDWSPFQDPAGGRLRFDAAGGSVLGQTAGSLLTIASGGLLVTDRVSSGAPSVTGGFIRSGTNELVVFQDSSRTFEIASTIASGQTLTKTGNGVLRLSGSNLSPSLVLQAGTVELSGGLFQTVHDWLPFTWVVKAFRASLFGAYDGVFWPQVHFERELFVHEV